MIIGREQLKQMYPRLLEEQYQPAGIDLTVGDIKTLYYTPGIMYGLLKNAKVLPEQKDLEEKKMQVAGMLKTGYVLEPHVCYIVTTAEKIKIDKHSGQFYLPRSSLLRGGVTVDTAFGDPGFNGHLSFLIRNNNPTMFFLEKGVRFAQLINISAFDVDKEYDGDYNES